MGREMKKRRRGFFESKKENGLDETGIRLEIFMHSEDEQDG